MWLLESEEAFQGRRLWLRPGKTYLFGRTAAEPGQLAISHNTISRKHLTITVDNVEAGGAHSVSGRSSVTIEDLATKIGTFVDGQKIKGSKYVVPGDEAEITMGKCPSTFCLRWFPVVFTFSFTNKELQAQPFHSLQAQFEQLDIKLLTDYNIQWTTPEDDDGSGSSHLEQDFDKYWPRELDHLPPRGGEPVQHPDDIYTPNPGRSAVFEGYTFIFYDQTQYHNLLAPITNGCGKAMLRTVKAAETTVDEFVRYVKEVAGEKGLGSFDDGSEGKGVVLVRYLPGKGDLIGWYTEFLTGVSLKLDHRPIEQNEFLEAILIKDASKLRRPLEVESSGGDQESLAAQQSQPAPASRLNQESQVIPAAQEPSQESQPAPLRRGGARKPVKRRFAGFDDDDDIDMNDIPPAPTTQQVVSQPAQPFEVEEEDGLFVSQDPNAPAVPESQAIAGRSMRSQRKRVAEPLPEDDLMEGMAPAVARFKRQRLDEAFAVPSPEPEEEPTAPTPVKTEKKKKIKEEIDVLAVAAKNREEAEARARAEQEDLANLPEGIDLAEIRRLNIVEEMEIRLPERASQRTRDKDVIEGRWDPRWNGLKNFKKFRRRGEAVGRQPARVIIALTEVKNKEFGVGDNYWLEDEASERKKAASHQSTLETSNLPPSEPSPQRRNQRVIALDSSDEDGARSVEPEPANRLATRRGGTQSQRSTRSQPSQSSQAKRAAPESAGSMDPPPAKRARSALKLEIADSDDSDDELKFRFGKRR
ncbi:hypothetical protein PT974_05929 [Cladobotryum mycophilum]|uniref:FHA domain-containing protein n=1 Tax=Cladobotryum mycophilum TaxID=491253 RepID=A0ABR0SK46_9HYPO